MNSSRYKVFIYTALPCEAKPLVKYFKLKKDTSVQPFSVYGNNEICLTVTGLGKCAMSAGVAYTQALFSSVPHPVLLNIGIAGHRDHALGSAFIIDKIIDIDNRKNFYPPQVYKTLCPAGTIQTASRPQLGYDHPYLCDMEASAFFETAIRFSTAELVQCVKIISDNRSSPADALKPDQAAAFIAAHMTTIDVVIAELIRLADLITAPEPTMLAELIRRYHFTASERGQLKDKLSRWNCLTGHQSLEFDEKVMQKGRDVLIWLEQELTKREFYL